MKNLYYAFFIPLLLLGFSDLYGQERTLSGTVTDSETGEPLIGATVVIKGTSDGTTTDFDGNFSLSISGDATLILTYIGYQSREVQIGSEQTEANISMTSGARLDEVIVTAFGVSRERKSLGYAVQELSNDEITGRAEGNLVNSMRGQLAGVQINSSSGAPGAGSDIIIRGINSFDPTANNQPLFVVDGIPVDNSTIAGNTTPSAGSNAFASSEQVSFTNRIADINPNDIESVSVLKGAAATALYGQRGSNGVVMITTKKGQAGAPKVELSITAGVEEIGQAQEFQTSYREGRFGRLRFNADGSPLRFQSFGPKIYEGLTPEFDPIDDFFQTGNRQDYSLGISGGTEDATYHTSIGYYRHEGIIPFSNWDRITAKLGGQLKLNDQLSVSGSVNFSNSGGNKPHSGDKSIMSSLSYYSTSFDINDYINPDGSQKDFSSGIIDNPRYLAEFSTFEDNVNRVIGNIGFNYKPLDWLSVDYRIGMDHYTDNRVRVVPPGLDLSSQVNGFIIDENIRRTELNSNLLVTATHQLTEDIGSSLTIGNNILDIQSKLNNVRGEDFSLPGFNNLINASNVFTFSNESQERLIGVFAQLSLDYKDYLYLELSGRNDWSSTLPIGNWSYFYPSASLAYVISDHLSLPDYFTYAKLRGSIAGVGKPARPHEIGTFFTGANNFPFGDVNGFVRSTTAGDLNLRPENTTSVEFGAELRFLENRLGFDVSWFQSNSKDQIFRVPVSNTTGFSTFITNAGEIETSGLEILAHATPLKTPNFSWNIGANFSTYKGEVISVREGIDAIEIFDGGFGGITSRFVPGGEVGDLYGFQYEYDDSGNLIIGDDGFPFIRTDTQYLVGNAFPDWTLGLTNTFRWKDFSLSILLEWREGGDVYDLGFRNSIRNGIDGTTERRYEAVIFDGVTQEGQPNTQVVEIDGETWYRNSIRYNRAAEHILEDASWFRLRNVTLTYNLPQSILPSGFISRATISLSGNNLFVDTPFRGYDPETNYFGSGSNIYGYTGLQNPATRTYSATLNVTF